MLKCMSVDNNFQTRLLNGWQQSCQPNKSHVRKSTVQIEAQCWILIIHAFILYTCMWVGVGGFSNLVTTFNHVGGSFNLFVATTGDVRLIPTFSNFGLYAACWANFMCHHELWPTPVSHPFSSRLLSLYSFLSLCSLLTFFWLVCFCSMWLCFSQGSS